LLLLPRDVEAVIFVEGDGQVFATPSALGHLLGGSQDGLDQLDSALEGFPLLDYPLYEIQDGSRSVNQVFGVFCSRHASSSRTVFGRSSNSAYFSGFSWNCSNAIA